MSTRTPLKSRTPTNLRAGSSAAPATPRVAVSKSGKPAPLAASRSSANQGSISPPKQSFSLREAIALKRAEAKKLQQISHGSSASNDLDSTAFDDPLPTNQQTGRPSSEDELLDLGRLSVRETIERARNTGTLNLATRSLVCIPSALFEIHLGIKPDPLRSVPDEPVLPPSIESAPKKGSKRENQPTWFEAQDLCVLKAWGNEIAEIQHEISLFGSLKTVDLHKNKLASLPPSFTDLTALTVLDLSFNALTEMPANLFALPNLATLNLSNNLLTALPFGLPFTEEVSRNSRYPSGASLFTPAVTRSTTPLPRLITFDASHNNITALSVDTASLPKALVKFDLSFNPLGNTGTAQLFSALSRLDRLKDLRFEKCDIGDEAFSAGLLSDSVPNIGSGGVADPFRSLQTLDLGETKVTQEVINSTLSSLKQSVTFEVTASDPPPGVLRVIVGKKVIREYWEIEAERKARSKQARSGGNEIEQPEDLFAASFESARHPQKKYTDDASPNTGTASAAATHDAVEKSTPAIQTRDGPKPREVVKEAWEIEAEQGLLTEGGKRRARAAAARAEAEAEAAAASVEDKATKTGKGVTQKKEVVKEQWEIDAELGLLTEGGKRRARAAAAADKNAKGTPDLGIGRPSSIVGSTGVGVSLSNPQYYNSSNQSLTLPASAAAPKNQLHARAFSLASSTNHASPSSVQDMALPTPTLPLAAITSYPFCDSLKVLVLANRRMDKTFALPPLFEGASGDSSSYLPVLEELSLEGCGLGDQVAVTRQAEGSTTPLRTNEPLIALLTTLFPSLLTLDLSYNGLTSNALTAPQLSSLLLRAPHRRGLRHLRLRGNRLTELDGLVGIAEMFKGNRDVPAWGVEELDLRDNEIGKLPAELGLLPLEVFLVDGNTFRVPQRRIWEREGTKGLLSWLRSRIE